MKAFEPTGMTFAEFHNGLRILINLDLPDLQDVGLFTEAPLIHSSKRPELGKNWTSFRDNPWRYFIRASDREGAAIWAAMQKRMRS